MTRLIILSALAIIQGIFVVGTLFLLLVTRYRGRRGRAQDERAATLLSGPLAGLMLGEDNGQRLADALCLLDAHVAARHLAGIGGSRLSVEQLRNLAALVRPAPWVEQILARGKSSRWWERMEAARLLSMVGGKGDEQLLTCLVTDPNPAVASAATAAIAAGADAALVAAMVKDLPNRPQAVRLQQSIALRLHSTLATEIVVPLLRLPGASSTALRAWMQLAETLNTPEALFAVIPLASHPNAEVRTSAARALRSCFFPEAVEAVIRLLVDEDWRVREAAARAVGSLNAVRAVPQLAEALRDPSWWVRFRSALALADLDEKGVAALESARGSDDEYARDIATLVCGLSMGSRLELTSA